MPIRVETRTRPNSLAVGSSASSTTSSSARIDARTRLEAGGDQVEHVGELLLEGLLALVDRPHDQQVRRDCGDGRDDQLRAPLRRGSSRARAAMNAPMADVTANSPAVSDQSLRSSSSRTRSRKSMSPSARSAAMPLRASNVLVRSAFAAFAGSSACRSRAARRSCTRRRLAATRANDRRDDAAGHHDRGEERRSSPRSLARRSRRGGGRRTTEDRQREIDRALGEPIGAAGPQAGRREAPRRERGRRCPAG